MDIYIYDDGYFTNLGGVPAFTTGVIPSSADIGFPIRRGHPGFVFKKPGKVIGVLKAQTKGRLFNRNIILFQKAFGLMYFYMDVILIRGHGRIGFEYLIEF
jgi:hypothetical protein